MDELALYTTNRPAWLVQVSPNMAHRLSTEPDATLSATWSRIPRDYQKATWQHMDDALRERIRGLRQNSTNSKG